MDRHDHDHAHDRHAPIEDREELTYYEKRTWAIQSLLVEKGVITADDVRRQIEAVDSRTPADGAKVIARASVTFSSHKAAGFIRSWVTGGRPDTSSVTNTPSFTPSPISSTPSSTVNPSNPPSKMACATNECLKPLKNPLKLASG